VIDVFDYTDRLVSTFIQLNYLIINCQMNGYDGCVNLYDLEIVSDDYYSGTTFSLFGRLELFVNRHTGQVTSDMTSIRCPNLLHATKVVLLPHDVGVFKKYKTILRFR
jgi:hypothetical protein